MKKKKKPIVYCGMTGDIVHHGHINILKVASGYGDVILGLLTDKAVSTYKKKTTLKYNNRKIVLQSIKYVKKIIPQKTLDYTQNLKKLKPNYVVHGSDWKNGVQKNTRNQVFQIKFDEVIIFQKLNNQENIILSVLDYLKK